MKMTPIALVRRLAFGLLLLSAIGVSHAQTTNPEDEYKKLVRVNDQLAPLGDTPFGEQIDLHDGSLTFSAVDIKIAGNGPVIQIGRTFKADGDADIRKDNASFGDWDIELPRLSTVVSDQHTLTDGDSHKGWLVNSIVMTDRCTNFREPPSMTLGRPGSEPLESDQWWNEGYLLRIPGEESQDMLARAPNGLPAPSMARTFVGVSKGNWQLACLPGTSNGMPGEAFLAIGPDGTQYSLDYLYYRPARYFIIGRQIGFMFATRVVDRFGRGVTYNYDAGRISSIIGDDLRRVDFQYTGDGKQIAQIVVSADGKTRTWSYSYQPSATGQTLTGVTLPDGTTWGYSLADLTFDVKSTASIGHCLDPSAPDENNAKVGTVTTPSGLVGTFTARPTRHARSDVFEYCGANGPTANGYESSPRYYNNLALRNKHVTGAGLDPQDWSYSYPLAQASWRQQCQAGGCTFTSYTDVVDPGQNLTRYYFSNRANVTEGKGVSTEYYAGGGGSPVRVETMVYALSGPWPAKYGYNFNIYANVDLATSEAPMSRRTITEGADAWTWQALSFDTFARPASTRRSSTISLSVGGEAIPNSVDEQFSYLDDLPHWVIGLPASRATLVPAGESPTGQAFWETVSRNVYNLADVTMQSREEYGQTVMSYTFDQGQLASFTDARQKTTLIGGYTRGIPTSIQFPDGGRRTFVVDGFGQVSSETDQLGQTTSYTYDAGGRLASTSYSPDTDGTIWSPSIENYAVVDQGERGLSGRHWRHTVTEGNRSQVTYLDAMFHPVLTESYRTSDGGLFTSTATRYDWKGRTTFRANALDGAHDVPSFTDGVYTDYDVLGRVTATRERAKDAEFLTSHDYLGGGRVRVTDPNRVATTTAYQSFDEPTYDNAVEIDAPEGLTQLVKRDTYGQPRWLSQGGIRKDIYYDANHRVCRTQEPEVGSNVVAYDAAGNVDWSASGVGVTGTGCGLDQVPTTARTTHQYDELGRVTTSIYPGITDSSSYVYDKQGNVQSQSTSGLVGWSFGRNRHGLLTTEQLSIDGWVWTIRYAYDASGALSKVIYPDGEEVAYAPDAMGRPTAAGSYVNNVLYAANSDVASFGLGSGASYVAAQNDRKMLGNFTFGRAGVPAVSEDYGYDANGNITGMTDQSGSTRRTKVLTYDQLNRLATATASNAWGSESYEYDALNNIRSITRGAAKSIYTYDSANRLATITAIDGSRLHTFGYDARGNTTGKDSAILTFDGADRLTGITGHESYVYDAAGRRVKRSVTGGATTYYAYNAAGQLLWQYDAGTTQATNYVYLGTRLVASSRGATSTVIGSVDGITSGSSAVLAGWACGTGLAASIDIHVYADGPAGSGAFVGAYHANVANDERQVELQTQCHAVGTAYRYSVAFTEAQRVALGGKVLYVHGISPVGGDNLLLSGSGSYTMPPSVSAPASPASASLAVSGDLSTLTVSWAATSNTTSYTVERSWNGENWPQVYSGAATTVSFAVAVEGGYVFRVKACNPNGCSVPTQTNAVTVRHTPAAPGSITVQSPSTGSIAIGWPAVSYGQTYAVGRSTDGANYSDVFYGAATSTTQSVSTTGTYWFRVRACNSTDGTYCGPSSPAAALSVTMPPAQAPGISVPGSSSDGCYTVNWSGVAGATSYVMQEQVNGGGFATIGNNGSGALGICGKGNGTYGYRVQGCNAGGCGPFSGTASVTVTLIPAIPGGIHMEETIVGKSQRYTLSWYATPNATRYEILNIQLNKTIYSGGDLSYRVEAGVFPYDLHNTYRLRACNAQGCSAWSAEITG
ncbi:hypothetical protein L2Y97_13275 [Luteibacter aegosomatissinici]|nr:hypothetical protein [Luteibacter aegosomatissinici]UPG96709.1 hypothetical protein L2Y97_13275 [Luteibacter aegosomatissinici]